MNNDMHTSTDGLDLIKKFEGFVPKIYDDVGNLAIGYGHNFPDSEKNKYENGITKEQATSLLMKDVEGAENAIKKYITVPLNQNQFDALVSMLFNTGAGPIVTGTLGKVLNNGDFEAASREMLRWTHGPDKKNMPVLQNRRQKEVALFTNSKSPSLNVPLMVATKQMPANNNMEQILNNYLQMVAASYRNNKKIYKKYLPTNSMIIKIKTPDYNNNIEFARILCSALDEELLSDSFIHTNGKEVEVECNITGPTQECFAAVDQLLNPISEAFKEATAKIGGISVKMQLIINKKSSYQIINVKFADEQYRMFLLKFI